MVDLPEPEGAENIISFPMFVNDILICKWKLRSVSIGHQTGNVAYAEGYRLHYVQYLFFDLFQLVLHLYDDVLHFSLV